MRVTVISAALAGGCLLLSHGAAWAQDAAKAYPSKPVRLVVPFTPSGSTDLMGRLFGQKLSEALGQQFIIDNRPGAGGAMGAEAVARALPDGYTLMVTNPGPGLHNILLRKKPTYDFPDFTPVFYIGSTPMVAVVNPKFPANDVKELIAYAKANPGKVTWGSSGNGSNPHAALEALKAVTGINVIHVPYKGTGPALADTVGGQIDGLYTTTVSAETFIRNGRAKALGVAGPKRQAVIPNVATLTEQGIKGADNVFWIGIMATAKTPRPIIDKLNRELNRILQTPEVRQRFEQLGVDPEGGTPEQFGKFIQGQADDLRKLVKAGMLPVE